MLNLTLTDPHDAYEIFFRGWGLNLRNLNDSQLANYLRH